MAREFKDPDVVLGPILFFRGEQGKRWRLSALFVLNGDTEPDDLRVAGVKLLVPPRHLMSWRGRAVWRFDFAVPRGHLDSGVSYGFDGGPTWNLVVPGRTSPPRVAYTTGNGQDDEAADPSPTLTPRNALWRQLLESHAEAPFHLLLHGGAQIAGGSVWRRCPSVAEWARKPAAQRAETPFAGTMAAEAMTDLMTRYIDTWSQPDLAPVLSRIPSIMMWDDQDLLDGWGALPAGVRAMPVARGLRLVARRAFAVFQMAATPDDPPECVWSGEHAAFTQGFRIGNIGLFAPDLLTERTRRRMFGDATWTQLPDWLERFAGCRHLLVMSSVPLLVPDLARYERLAGSLPLPAWLAEDLVDQWRSIHRAGEWRRLIDLLTGFSVRNSCRVTVLSGRLNLGARAVLRSDGAELWQLVAGGMVQQPPAPMTATMLERLAARPEALEGRAELAVPPYPETGHSFIRARNWLSLDFDLTGDLLARWHAEGSPPTYEQII